MTILSLPPVYCPFKYQIHPRVAQFDQATANWLDYWELYWDEPQRRRMVRPGWGELAALAYPTGSDELIQLASDWMAWAFAYDDEWCDEGPVTKKPEAMIMATAQMNRALECPEYPVSPDERYALSMQELRIRLARHATPEQVNRVVEAQKGYFIAEMVKAGCMNPTLDECTFLRLNGGGGMIFPVLRHVVAGIDITQDEYLSRPIIAMTEMAATLVVWENELFSYAKESLRNSLDCRGHNLIDAIRRQYHYSAAEALQWLNAMHDRIMGLFVRLREKLLQDANPQIADYIEALIHYQTGILEWHRRDRRYRFLNAEDNRPCFDGGEPADRPSDDSLEPVPLPSIAWWWSYDPARQAVSVDYHPNDRVIAARRAGRAFNVTQERYSHKAL